MGQTAYLYCGVEGLGDRAVSTGCVSFSQGLLVNKQKDKERGGKGGHQSGGGGAGLI